MKELMINYKIKLIMIIHYIDKNKLNTYLELILVGGKFFMEDIIDNYNLGIVEKIKEDRLIMKPVIVIDKTGYENFEIILDEKLIELYREEFEEAGGTIMLAYDSNKNIINN